MKNVIIETEKLCKSFTMGKGKIDILKDIDLKIYEGDFTVIMGSSGSGKSTLLYALSSMDKPTGGKVKLMNKDITNLTEKQLAQLRSKEVSFVFQSINLVPDLSSFENIAYPAYMVMSKADANKRTEELLKKMNLWEQKDKYPNEMSGGQQQRIAIGRAIAAKPKILFGDEPTGALNSSSGVQVLDLFSECNQQGQSIIMVTHDIKACARGNRLIYLSDGRVKGDLDLGQYRPEEQVEREEKVFRFLKANNW